jgi:hypothetical protein
MITKTFEFVSDFATVHLTLESTEPDWTDEMWDSVAEDELANIVKEPKLFYLNEVYLDG